MRSQDSSRRLKQFQEKWKPVFRPELRQNKEQFQEKWKPVFRPELRQNKAVGRRLAAAAAIVLYCAGTAALAQMESELTGPTPPMENLPAPPVPKWVTDDVRQMRAYPEQPPVIPHSIEGYQLSVNTNRCLSCHKREFTQGSGAPMISVTHYMTRDGQMLADVSPRRYFCTACHVPQANVRPLVENRFKDMSELGVEPAGSE